jgi:hypothetical protein
MMNIQGNGHFDKRSNLSRFLSGLTLDPAIPPFSADGRIYNRFCRLIFLKNDHNRKIKMYL